MSNKTNKQIMIDLEWDRKDLKEAEKMLADWDKRDDSYYKNVWKPTVKVDKAEREHLRDCVKFWQERLKNETKPT